MEKRQLKPWMAVIFVPVFWIDIFILSGWFGRWFGVWGALIGELLLIVLAVGIAAVFGADLRRVFPLKRPEAAKTGGTIVLWFGTFLAAMGIVGVLSYFFPQQMMGAGEDLGSVVMTLPAWFSLFLVALTPAVCEEVAFRGAFLGCFRGIRNKWIGILLVSVVFGLLHGSVWRAIPTALLGIAMGYLLTETDNMFYNMLFHLINNAVPIFLLLFLSMMPSAAVDQSQMAEVQQQMAGGVSLMVMAVYLMYSSGAPLLLYIGNYLIHRGQPGYTKGIFPREKRWQLVLLLVVSFFLFLMGMLLMFLSTIVALA